MNNISTHLLLVHIIWMLMTDDKIKAPSECEWDVGNSIGVDGVEETTDGGRGVG